MPETSSSDQPWQQPGWLSPDDFKASPSVDDWRPLGDAVYAFFATDSFSASARLIQAIADLPADGHQPDVDVRPDGVTVKLTMLTTGRYFCGFSKHEVARAQQISAVARDLGIAPDPARLQHVQVSIDALDIPGVMPFWRAALGYEFRRDTEEDIVDPRGRGPSFWFQQMAEPRTQRNRIHVDVAVPAEVVAARVDAVLAAGGRRPDPEHPWILSDPEGNEVCLG